MTTKAFKRRVRFLLGRVRDLEDRDQLRRAELADTDAALAEARERERRLREPAAVVLTETDYELE